MDPVECIIETPRGSRQKYSFDEERKLYKLGKVLPAGMSFPYDFGFIPGTRGEDGDPLDVIVLLDEPAYPGILVPARIVGVFEAEEREEGRTQRNDRFIAVALSSYTYADWNDLEDLSDKLLDDLEKFLVNYQQLAGKEYKVLRRGDAEAAEEMFRSNSRRINRNGNKSAKKKKKSK